MVVGLTWLVVCQLVGEVLVRLTGAPVPGPVAGMVVLLAALEVRRRRRRDRHGEPGAGDPGGPGDPGEAPVVRAADRLLAHLQLLFVPAGAGVVAHLGVLRSDAVPVVVAVVGSWALGLVVVGWTARLLTGRAAGRA
ncbi:CidA/LrgA family protein [Nocardioides sp. SYSU DS0663]|uniref:CidA/LrgA family protein n=1 Tax=Nocardioides sp. SYSU DS0663 TaxID=3416445 RepID=UPI003F4B20EA